MPSALCSACSADVFVFWGTVLLCAIAALV